MDKRHRNRDKKRRLANERLERQNQLRLERQYNLDDFDSNLKTMLNDLVPRDINNREEFIFYILSKISEYEKLSSNGIFHQRIKPYVLTFIKVLFGLELTEQEKNIVADGEKNRALYWKKWPHHFPLQSALNSNATDGPSTSKSRYGEQNSAADFKGQFAAFLSMMNKRFNENALSDGSPIYNPATSSASVSSSTFESTSQQNCSSTFSAPSSSIHQLQQQLNQPAFAPHQFIPSGIQHPQSSQAATVNAKSHSKKRRLEEIETDEERWRRDPLDLDGIVPLAPGQIGGDELLGGNGTKENRKLRHFLSPLPNNEPPTPPTQAELMWQFEKGFY